MDEVNRATEDYDPARPSLTPARARRSTTLLTNLHDAPALDWRDSKT